MADTLEKRVEALEQQVRKLSEKFSGKPDDQDITGPPDSDIDAIFGRFADDPTYEEAARLGAAWRRRQPKC